MAAPSLHTPEMPSASSSSPQERAASHGPASSTASSGTITKHRHRRNLCVDLQPHSGQSDGVSRLPVAVQQCRLLEQLSVSASVGVSGWESSSVRPDDKPASNGGKCSSSRGTDVSTVLPSAWDSTKPTAQPSSPSKPQSPSQSSAEQADGQSQAAGSAVCEPSWRGQQRTTPQLQAQKKTTPGSWRSAAPRQGQSLWRTRNRSSRRR